MYANRPDGKNQPTLLCPLGKSSKRWREHFNLQFLFPASQSEENCVCKSKSYGRNKGFNAHLKNRAPLCLWHRIMQGYVTHMNQATIDIDHHKRSEKQAARRVQAKPSSPDVVESTTQSPPVTSRNSPQVKVKTKSKKETDMMQSIHEIYSTVNETTI